MKLKEDCLLDLKTRLIDQANMIQKRFEIETGKLTIQNPKTFSMIRLKIFNINYVCHLGKLKEKQQDYQERQNHMTKDDEDAYRGWCSEGNFFTT